MKWIEIESKIKAKVFDFIEYDYYYFFVSVLMPHMDGPELQNCEENKKTTSMGKLSMTYYYMYDACCERAKNWWQFGHDNGLSNWFMPVW